jgi:hypothetical protein
MDVHDCLGKQSVCIQLIEGEPVYVHNCQGKKNVYVSKKQGQAWEKAENLDPE